MISSRKNYLVDGLNGILADFPSENCSSIPIPMSIDGTSTFKPIRPRSRVKNKPRQWERPLTEQLALPKQPSYPLTIVFLSEKYSSNKL